MAMEFAPYIKFNFRFDETRLVNDLDELLRDEWIPHFHHEDYAGTWQVLPLLTPDGDPNYTFSTGSIPVPLKPTPFLKRNSYLAETISYFKCPLHAVRLLRLAPGAWIKPHQDNLCGYENNAFRIHIPILTNPGILFMLHGEQLNMKPGECWYINANYEHSVRNNGNVDRVHLVIDGERNLWSDELFFSYISPERLLINLGFPYDLATMNKIHQVLIAMQADRRVIKQWEDQIEAISIGKVCPPQ